MLVRRQAAGLVEGTLEEGRVDRAEGLDALRGHAGRERHLEGEGSEKR